MRIIRTEMFFEDVGEIGLGVSKAGRMNPGLGIAFLKISPTAGFPFASILRDPLVYSNPNEREVRRFLDLCVRGIERSYGHPHSKYWRDDIHNSAIVDYIMNANIVIEQSPHPGRLSKLWCRKAPELVLARL